MMSNQKTTQLITKLFLGWFLFLLVSGALYGVGAVLLGFVAPFFNVSVEPFLILGRQIIGIVACGVLGPLLTYCGMAILYVFFRNKILRFRWVCKEGKVMDNKTRLNKYQELEYAAVVKVEIDAVSTQVTDERYMPHPWTIGQQVQVWFKPHVPERKVLVEYVPAPWWFGIWMLLFGLLGFFLLWICIFHEGHLVIHL